jgi:hypothetical protein
MHKLKLKLRQGLRQEFEKTEIFLRGVKWSELAPKPESIGCFFVNQRSTNRAESYLDE